jgi:hypothetical protein
VSSTNSTKNRGELVFRKGKPFLLHMCHSSFYSCYKPSDMLWMKHMRVNNFTRAVMRIIYIYIYLYWCNLRIHFYTIEGPSWSYGSWIYNYLCNRCLSPPTLWVRTPLRWSRLHTTLCDKDWQWLATGRWKPPGTPVASTTKTDHHDITEILLKVALNIHLILFY